MSVQPRLIGSSTGGFDSDFARAECLRRKDAPLAKHDLTVSRSLNTAEHGGLVVGVCLGNESTALTDIHNPTRRSAAAHKLPVARDAGDLLDERRGARIDRCCRLRQHPWRVRGHRFSVRSGKPADARSGGSWRPAIRWFFPCAPSAGF